MSTYLPTSKYCDPSLVYPVVMEDEQLHCAPYYFCTTGDPTCPCHNDPDLLARVQAEVLAGLLTDEEATRIVQGRQLPAHGDHPMMRSSTSNLLSETKHPRALPSAEWTPLDDLIQTWARFASATISQSGLEATSSAFTALALETRARKTYADAVHERGHFCWTPRWQMLLHHTLCDLSDACAHWIAAAELLSRVQAVQDEEAALAVPDVGRAVACHVQQLFPLFLRLLQEHETALFGPHAEEVA